MTPMKNMTPPPGHSVVPTSDGSFTLFSDHFQEACHSTNGARSETMLHYLEGCQIKKKIEVHRPLIILEIGFGLGIGFLTTFEEMNTDRPWHFISVEMDESLVEWFRLGHSEHTFLKHLSWKEEFGIKILSAQHLNVTLTILVGNARETLPSFTKATSIQWHAIYQDAFSPKKNPILWSKEWFSFLKEYSHPDVILSTYSASSSIRKSLHETGWGVQKGEKFGPKRSSTRATLNAPTDPDILLQLERSPVLAISDSKLEEFLRK